MDCQSVNNVLSASALLRGDRTLWLQSGSSSVDSIAETALNGRRRWWLGKAALVPIVFVGSERPIFLFRVSPCCASTPSSLQHFKNFILSDNKDAFQKVTGPACMLAVIAVEVLA